MSANMHRRVDAVAPHRLQRHLGAELGLVRDLEERVALADRAVLRQRAARLAHEPDGRALDALAPRGADEKRIGHPGSVARRRARTRLVRRGSPRTVLAGVDAARRSARARARRRASCSRTTGSATWRSRGEDGLQLAYHWLDTRGNAIVWDGHRTPFPRPIAPGETIELDAPVTAPRPPGPLRPSLRPRRGAPLLALRASGCATLDVEVDVEPLIAERRLAVVVHGGADERTAAALAAQEEPVVDDAPRRDRAPRRGRGARARLVATPARRACRGLGRRRAARSSPTAARSSAAARRVRFAAGPREAGTRGSTRRSFSRRSSTALAPGEHLGLPAYDGRRALRGSRGRQASDAIRSSTDLNTSAPTASATTAATQR